MTQQNKLYEAAKAFVESEENKFILFVNLCEAVDAYTQHIGKHEPSLDKLAETVLREYVKFKDVNGSRSVGLLPLTIVDMMVEFIDRVNEQPEAIAAFEQSTEQPEAIAAFEQSTEQPEAIAGEKTTYETALDYLSEMGYGSGTNFTSKGVASLLADFASQQTASKDKQLNVQQSHIDEQDQLIFEQAEEIKELKEAISELIQVKDWKDKYGKDEHYLKAMPIAWENARKLIQK